MADKKKPTIEESTLIKPYEELEKSRATILNNEAFPLLEIVHGPKQGAWFSLGNQGEVSLGRAPTNAIILEDNSVSRSHCILEADGNEWFIRDIGSRNGTFVNGKKIPGPQTLHHLDIAKVGIYTLRFLEEPTDEAFIFKDDQETTEKPESTPDTASVSEFAPAASDEPGLVIGEEASNLPAVPESETQDISELPASVPQEVMVPPPSPSPKPRKKKSKASLVILSLLVFLLLAGASGVVAYYTGKLDPILAYFKSSKPTKPTKPTQPVVQPNVPIKPINPVIPAAVDKVPVFLEVSASPIQAEIFYEGKKLGVTPFKISEPVPVGQSQELTAEFFLKSIQEKVTEKLTFQAQKQDDLINLQFKPKLGTLKIQALPRLGEVYLEIQTEGSMAPKSIQLSDISYTEPVYLPYGKYNLEIRVPEKPEGSNAAIKNVKFKREFTLNESSAEFVLNASDEALKKYPAKITSTPSKADLLVDGKKVGETPFEGDLPTGRHKLTLKKEGYNDFEKEVSFEVNSPFTIAYNLETTAAGEYVNKGRSALKKGVYNEAIDQLAEALKRNPDANEQVQIYMLLGEAFLNTKTYDQSLAYYQKAVDNPEYGKRAQLGKAMALHGSGQTDQALVQVIDVFINTQDAKIKSEAETAYNRISPSKSVLYIVSEPAGAPVLINGNPINQETPVILSELMIGSYRVGIQKPGFKNYESRVTVPVSAIKPVIVKLEPEE